MLQIPIIAMFVGITNFPITSYWNFRCRIFGRFFSHGRHLSVSREAGSAPSRVLPVAAALGNRVGLRQEGPEARPGAFPSSPPPRLGGGEQLRLSQALDNQPPRTLAPATSQAGLQRLHPTRGAGSERPEVRGLEPRTASL